MEAASNYWVFWVIYLVASAVFFPIFWRMTAFKRALWLSYSLRAITAALILTPWYANAQGASLAPALMVALMDAITIGPASAGRALVPLVLGVLAAEVVATLAYLVRKRSKRLAKQRDSDNT